MRRLLRLQDGLRGRRPEVRQDRAAVVQLTTILPVWNLGPFIHDTYDARI